MGDEPASPSTPSSASTAPASTVTHDLLADIFGSSSISTPAPTPPTAPTGAPRSAVDDIMGLFGPSTTTTPAAAPIRSQMPATVAPSPQPQPRAAPSAQPAMTAYTAYEKNGLKITLTPRASPTQAGVIQILAKFTSYEGSVVKNVNFQAAVPRVSTVSACVW